MPALENSRHELFVQALLQGMSAKQAYISAGYAEKAAESSAALLVRNPKVSGRLKELRKAIDDAFIAAKIAFREHRVLALNERWERMKLLIEARSKEYAGIAGADSGLLVKTVKSIRVTGGDGKPQLAKLDEFMFDAALMREMREIERQAAIEVGQWQDSSKEIFNQKDPDKGTVLWEEFIQIHRRKVETTE